MQWFKHDTDAITDAKIKKLIMRFGADGYAIYFHCIELIAGSVSEHNITFELEHDAEIIADNLKIQGTSDTSAVDRVNQIMRYIVSLGLFEENNGHIFCFKILKRLDTSMTSNPKMREIITSAKKSHDTIMINHDGIMQEEKRREEKRIDNKDTRETPDKPAKRATFQKPSLDDVKAYCQERKNKVDPAKFLAYYDSNGWKVGRNAMKDWRAAVRTWEGNGYDSKPSYSKPLPIHTQTKMLDLED